MTTTIATPTLSIAPAAVLAAVLALGAAAAPASAAPQTVAEIAAYMGPDRQAMLEAGARKEGEVQAYSTQTQNQEILEAFGKKYPFLRVQFFRGDAAQVSRRWLEEYKAGRFLADLYDGGSTPLRQFADAGYLQSFNSPELAAMRKEAIADGNLWANNYESYLNLGFNTKVVPENEAPKTYDDLLNPKWKGKMTVPGSTTLGNWVGAMVLDKGEDFVRKLGGQDIKVFNVSGRAVANLVVSGEVPLSPASFDSHIKNSQAQGASVAWRALGGVYSTTGAVALASKAPHPHAAMLYIDYMLTREAQIAFQKLGYASGRTDLEGQDKPSKIYYLAERPNYVEEYEKWTQLGRQVFGRGEAPKDAK